MRKHALWLALCVALGLGGCATFRAPQTPLLDTSKACAEWRWIGISRVNARCPEVPGWEVRPLFSQLAPPQVGEANGQSCSGIEETPEQSQKRIKLIRELNRFCVYEIADEKKRLKDLLFPPRVSADLVRVDQDCAALATSAKTQVAPADWDFHFKNFLGQVGRLHPNGEEALPLSINGWLGVRLAFLDTQPTSEGAPEHSGNSPHGFALPHIARQLVCTLEPHEHCAAQITTRLAMPIIEFDPKSRKGGKRDEVKGGFLGMQSDLAEAIRAEVDDWQQKKAQKHLVLNLSLAWDGDLFGGLGEEQVSELRAGTQAVYLALEYAASFDVLVIAAAGNQKPLPCRSTGPLLPAGWEGNRPGEHCGEASGAPLLYAVGGAQSNGYPINSARPGGMPPRAAYARNAVVPSLDPTKPTAMLTGSSVAAAVVSSIAAIVWDTRPDLNSGDVMRFLELSGDGLRFPANFGVHAVDSTGSSRSEASRISLCAALQWACTKDTEDGNRLNPCPVAPGDCDRWPPPELDVTPDLTFPGSCQPWLVPQPEDPPCPNENCIAGRPPASVR